MKVIIASPYSESPAAHALTQEDVSFELVECTHLLDYARLWCQLWGEGEPFVLLEWDVVPWPGAVERLSWCLQPWCTHYYPVYPNNLITALGCVKVTPRGRAPAYWSQAYWPDMEVAVIPDLQRLYGEPHIHEPPVSHARPVKIRNTSEVYARG